MAYLIDLRDVADRKTTRAILLFTYVNLYLLVLLFILSFIVSYYGGNKGGGGGYFVFKVLTLTGCTRIFGVPRHSSGKGAR